VVLARNSPLAVKPDAVGCAWRSDARSTRDGPAGGGRWGGRTGAPAGAHPTIGGAATLSTAVGALAMADGEDAGSDILYTSAIAAVAARYRTILAALRADDPIEALTAFDVRMLRHLP